MFLLKRHVSILMMPIESSYVGHGTAQCSLILECQQVLEALGSMEFPNIYPDPESRRLRTMLAKDTGLEAEHILVGCGADELIDLIMR